MKKPKPKTQIELATLLGVSRKTLGNWKREGMATDEENLDALRKRAGQVESRQGITAEIQEARLRKLKAEGDRLEHALEAERGKWILKTDMMAACSQFAMLCVKLWEETEQELPPLLDGLSALAMASKLREVAKSKIAAMHNCFPD